MNKAVFGRRVPHRDANLSSLNDVEVLVQPSDGQSLVYSSDSGKWVLGGGLVATRFSDPIPSGSILSWDNDSDDGDAWIDRKAVNLDSVRTDSLIADTEFSATFMTSVTQTGGVTAGVTVDARAYEVVTDSQTLAAGGQLEFTITNANSYDESFYFTSFIYAGTGSPNVYIKSHGWRTLTVAVHNNHATDPLNDVIKINFWTIGSLY